MNPWPKRVASHLLHFQYQPLHTAHYVCACACICVCVCVKVKNILCSTHVQGMYLMDLRRYVNKPTITVITSGYFDRLYDKIKCKCHYSVNKIYYVGIINCYVEWSISKIGCVLN